MLKRKSFWLWVLLWLLMMTTGALAAPAWPTAGGNAARTGLSPFYGPAAFGNHWVGIAPAAIGGDGTLYAYSGTTVYAYWPDYTVKWLRDLSSQFQDGSYSASHITGLGLGSDESVYVTADRPPNTGSGSYRAVLLFKLDSSGNVAWRSVITKYSTNSFYRTALPPVVGPDGAVYVAWGESSNIAYLDRYNSGGSLSWRQSLGVPYPTYITVGASRVAVTSYSGYGYYSLVRFGFDGSYSGELSSSNSGEFVLPVYAADGTLLVLRDYVFSWTQYYTIEAYDANLNRRWVKDLGHRYNEGIFPGLAVKGSTIYVVAGIGSAGSGWWYPPQSVALRALDLSNGNQLWETNIGSGNNAGNIILDNAGTAYVVRTNTVYAIASNGTIKWQGQTGNIELAAMGPEGALYGGGYRVHPVRYGIEPPTITSTESGGLAWHPSEGRGYVRLTWSPSPNPNPIGGYYLHVFDGQAYRLFDLGNDTRELLLYPSEATINGYATNTRTADIFNHQKGGLNLRDDPSNLYRSAQDSTYNNSHNYWFYVSAYSANLSKFPSSNTSSGYFPTLPNRTDLMPPQVQAVTINGGAGNTQDRNITVSVQARDPAFTSYSGGAYDKAGLDRIQLSNDGFVTSQEYRLFYYPDSDGNGTGSNLSYRYYWNPALGPGDGRGGLAVEATHSGGSADHYANDNIVIGDNLNIPITSDTYLGYHLYILQNTNLRFTVQFQTTDGQVHWSDGLVDQNGVSANWNTNLLPYAQGKYYYRKISLAPLAGKTLKKLFVMVNDDPADTVAGTYTAYITGIQVGPAWLVTESAWSEGTVAVPWQLSAGEGTKTVFARAVDRAGNVGPAQAATVYLVNDTAPPQVTVKINGGATTVTSRYVDVNIEAQDNLTLPGQLTMRLSADGGSTWTAWQTYATLVSGFDLGTSAGLRTVRVEVKDANGNVGSGSASVYYAAGSAQPSDSTPSPTVNASVGENLNGKVISLNSLPTTVVQGDAASVSFTGLSTSAGPLTLSTSFDGVNWSPTDTVPAGSTSFNKVLTFPREGAFAVSFKFRNGYGAESPVYTRYYLVDHTPPEIEVKMANGASATTGSTVQLVISARDNVSPTLYYSINGSAYQALPPGGVVTSPTLAPGYNTLRVKVIDRAGNVAAKTVNVWKL